MDGKTIHYIYEFDKGTKGLIKVTIYYDDGTTISSIDECDNNVKLIKTTTYNSDGTIESVIKF